MAARTDCRHYSSRTIGTGDVVERCKLDAADPMPFSCPDDCLFFEGRSITDSGWQRPPPQPSGE